MSKDSKNYFLGSLRGRILLAAGSLVALDLLFGLLAFLAVSSIGLPPGLVIFAALAAAAGMTGAFGWWLTNETIRPIESVSLIAKSLERSSSASLPKTTGASETDEILRTLARNSQQIHNLITLMDDVAAGKTQAALAPLQNADRLSVSFQKLVSKVTESVSAKHQLDELRTSVNRLKHGLSGVRRGDLNVEFHGDLRHVEEIADSFRLVAGRLRDLTTAVSAITLDARSAATRSRQELAAVIDADQTDSLRVEKAIGSRQSETEKLSEIARRLETAALRSPGTPAPDGDGTAADKNAAASLLKLKNSLSEARKHLDKLRESGSQIPQIARSADELSRRSNLIATNLSIGSGAGGGAIVADEIATLSARAQAVRKDAVSINESLMSEINRIADAISVCNTELSAISSHTAMSADQIEELENSITMFTVIQKELSQHAAERAANADNVSRALLSGPSGSDRAAKLASVASANEMFTALLDTLADACRTNHSHVDTSDIPHVPPAVEAPVEI